MEPLIIQKTVAYMLKAMKLNVNIQKFQSEFASIRHGNYFEFINIIQSPIPTVVVYNSGNIKVTNTIEKGEIDFSGLIKSGPSLLDFFKKCQNEYGELIDKDIPDDIYEKTVLFEIGLRMHANNHNLIKERAVLIDVIQQISKFKELSEMESKILDNGRRFLNMIKHNKNQFPDWQSGIVAFEEAYEIIKNHKLTVI
ncbi:hypothetical protein ACFS5J_11415 [Flavobacterium chuncheonense]|uniref:Uncharacterized protein n=1 Tax=Flavobacterium chuncheonense TaxID=2026653 RepID=A0ABW5YPS1_9FLAO